MNSIAKNILAVLSGVVVGSIVNMALIKVGPMVIPNPEGTDLSTMESLRDSMALYKPINFFFPFMAHAFGTLCGAFLTAKIASSHKMKLAIGIGVFFLLGGASMAYMLRGPMWFNVADLLLAYIPMGYLGGMLACRK